MMMVSHKEHRQQLPPQFVDSHQHFLDTGNNDFQSFVGSLLLPSKSVVYGPLQYQKDVIEPLIAAGCEEFVGSVHVECMPDDSVAEAKWAAASSPYVRAVVASCDLSSLTLASSSSSSSSDNNKAETILQQLQGIPKVKGIRWILDHVGQDYTPTNATHVATTRHPPGQGDYLNQRCSSNNNSNNNDKFIFDLSLLQKYNYSFDLQCAPEQLEAAFQMCAQTPDVPVAIDHLGKPRIRQQQQKQQHDDDDDGDDCFDLEIWKRGMQHMAQLPNTYCKISMLGYICPGWYNNNSSSSSSNESTRTMLLIKDLVCQVIQWFGPKRCMVALNWWKDAAVSDSDGWSDQGPSPVEFLSILQEWFVQEGLSEDDRYELFCGTARRFYRF